VRDAEYPKWLREMPCAVCAFIGEVQKTRTEAHHTTSRGAGGGDDTAAPTCKAHHQQYHVLGRKSFKQKYGVDLPAIAGQLWKEWQRYGWAA